MYAKDIFISSEPHLSRFLVYSSEVKKVQDKSDTSV